MTTHDANLEEDQMRSSSRSLCLACGKPIVKNNYCSECVALGLSPCETCEGLPLDIEEDAP